MCSQSVTVHGVYSIEIMSIILLLFVNGCGLVYIRPDVSSCYSFSLPIVKLGTVPL